MFYVYIIYSEKLNCFYIGTTDDVGLRILEHNSGVYIDSFTLKGIPWTHFLSISGLGSKQAYAIEKHIKQMKSKKYIHDLLEHPEIINRLKLKFG